MAPLKHTVTVTHTVAKVDFPQTVTALYYAKLLGRFETEFHLTKKKVYFHQDNKPRQINQIRLPTAVPVRLFFCCRQKFESNGIEGAYRPHEGLLCVPPENTFFRWVKKLEHRWVKYIELKRDYVVK